MSAVPSSQRTALGVLLACSAVTVFTLMSAFVKAADRIPAGETMFFRSALALPVVLAWLFATGGLKGGIATTNYRGHAARGIAGSLAMGLGFAGLKYLPLPEVTAIRFVTPVFLVVLAALMLGERLRLVRISAVLVGLVGVVIITAPRFSAGLGSNAALGALLTLGSASLAALAQVFVKSMSGRETTAAIVFYFSLTAATLSLLTIPFGWVMPFGIEWVWLAGAGLVGGIGQILLTASYRHADAGVLAPFTYISMLWSIVIGYFWFGEVPTLPMLGGAGLIILAGVAIVLRERQLGLRTTAERQVAAKTMR
ncbi:Putative transporter, RarD family, DMT superfamily protein [Oceanicola granulosus HTCC2516]|uniref:Putative transporter, RarD family, DMT superfamily protein n=1 Tax=Oceanicola granulosus (strain ATCC BAA-861 / DSM 15982 / KCTC 12143 / HTCC2516) TaxID=314256 RepID=Q2CKC9_OCEGH|nr:DMT family transporter [Oceanicola granulosus]EAR52860.1 Putative transporter, RarD family, DMT superfamily protein [Oceanicola granulosus HTCC2516]